jgi:hypothetical protein
LWVFENYWSILEQYLVSGLALSLGEFTLEILVLLRKIF